MGKQELLSEFYDIDNLVTVELDLPDYEELKAQEPAGKTGYAGKRYTYFKANSITISGSKFPKKPATFKNVGVIKKSYFGSFSKEKPSMKVDFTRYDKKLEDDIEDLIGTERLTLNNCQQDPGYLRQPLVYELLRQAKVPYFRCNFVKVIVNGTDTGLYVNLEPFRKPYLKRNFDNDKGNAYEVDFGGDIRRDTFPDGTNVVTHEGFSDYEDMKDIGLAADLIKNEGLAGAKKAFDWPSFIRFWAMEVLLRHRDGYTCHQNNSFAYNDVKAVKEPTEKDLNFRFVMSGTDLTLGQNKDIKFYYGTRADLAKLVIKDEAAFKELKDQIKKYSQTVFSPDNYEKSIKPFISRLEAQMKAGGIQFDDAIQEQISWVHKALQAAGTNDVENLNPKE